MYKTSRIPPNLTLRGPILDHYYHDFTYELSTPRPTDAAGIPLWDYGYPIGARYHPVLMGAHALALHEHFLNTNDAASKQKFLLLAARLVKMQAASETGISWNYDVPNFKYYLIPPWLSGMSQGLALSVLLRAHQLEPNSNYLECASRALRSFELDALQGGCRQVDAHGNVWYEETPSTAPVGAAHILNGFFFALWGLYDYSRAIGDSRARELFEHGVATLQNVAPQFDTGYWTRYSLAPHHYLADRFYHKVHIDGMTIFHGLTQDARLDTLAKRWTSYSQNPVCLARWRLTFTLFRVLYKLARARTYWRLL